jgi:hypothetical protein
MKSMLIPPVLFDGAFAAAARLRGKLIWFSSAVALPAIVATVSVFVVCLYFEADAL